MRPPLKREGGREGERREGGIANLPLEKDFSLLVAGLEGVHCISGEVILSE